MAGRARDGVLHQSVESGHPAVAAPVFDGDHVRAVGDEGPGRQPYRSRDDRIAIDFSGSKKSLVNGLRMAAVLFGAKAGLTVLPLMLFRQMQLVGCAVIAGRWSGQPGEPPPQEEPGAAALVP